MGRNTANQRHHCDERPLYSRHRRVGLVNANNSLHLFFARYSDKIVTRSEVFGVDCDSQTIARQGMYYLSNGIVKGNFPVMIVFKLKNQHIAEWVAINEHRAGVCIVDASADLNHNLLFETAAAIAFVGEGIDDDVRSWSRISR